MLPKAIIILLLILVSVPAVSFANGGDQRVAEGKYLINLSRAPFTPRIGVKTSFLASFVDIQKNKLISEDLAVRIRISKLGDAPKGNFIFVKDNISVKGGVLELSYSFIESGLHEIFFDFAFASSPEIVHEAPDFLIDIQKEENHVPAQKLWFIGIGTGIMGMMIGFLLSKIKIRKQV